MSTLSPIRRARREQIQRVWSKVTGQANAELAGSELEWKFLEALLKESPDLKAEFVILNDCQFKGFYLWGMSAHYTLADALGAADNAEKDIQVIRSHGSEDSGTHYVYELVQTGPMFHGQTEFEFAAGDRYRNRKEM